MVQSEQYWSKPLRVPPSVCNEIVQSLLPKLDRVVPAHERLGADNRDGLED
jgi:hypothetical protein